MFQHVSHARGGDASTGRCSLTHHRVGVATLAQDMPGVGRARSFARKPGHHARRMRRALTKKREMGETPVYEVNRLRPPAWAPCSLLWRGRNTAQLLLPPKKRPQKKSPKLIRPEPRRWVSCAAFGTEPPPDMGHGRRAFSGRDGRPTIGPAPPLQDRIALAERCGHSRGESGDGTPVRASLLASNYYVMRAAFAKSKPFRATPAFFGKSTTQPVATLAVAISRNFCGTRRFRPPKSRLNRACSAGASRGPIGSNSAV